MRWQKPLVWIAGLLGVLLLCLAAIVVSAPLWIDAENIKARVSESIANTTNGNARFEKIDLQYIPVPGVTITRLQFSLPGVLDLEAESASIELDLPALLTARIQPGTLRIANPQVTLQIPPSEQDNESPSIENLEETLRGVLSQISKYAPAIEMAIDDGSVLIQMQGRQLLSVDGLRLRAETEEGRIDATMSCRSNLWNSITLEMEVIDNDLTANGSADVVGLRIADIGKIVGKPEQWPIHNGLVDANLVWRLEGFANMDVQASLSGSTVSLRFGERHLDLVRPNISASAQLHDGVAAVSILQLVLEQPRLEGSAKLTQSDPGGVSIEAQFTNADISDLIAAAGQLAPQIDVLAQPPIQFEQGTITSARLQSAAATYSGLLEPTTLQAQIEIDDAVALVPEYDLRIDEFGANGSLDAGRLTVSDIFGRIGKSVLRNGSLSATLSNQFLEQRAQLIAQDAAHVLESIQMATLIKEHIAFDAGATLGLDLAENLAIAKRFIGDGEARHELDRIKQLEGRADILATATVTPQQPEIRLDVSAIELNTRHAAVPFPISARIESGAIRYVNNAIHAQGLNGAIGRTTFRDIGARVGLRAPYKVAAGTGSIRLALDQLMHWAITLPELSQYLDGIDKIGGVVSASVLKLEGPLLSPETLQYELNASPGKVSIEAPEYGPHAIFDGGVIGISNTHIRFKDVRFSALDASLQVGGEIKDYRNGLNALQTRLDGFAGLKSLEWVRGRAGLPENLRLRNSLKLSGVEALWRRNGQYAAQGNIQVTDGPAIGIEIRGSPDNIEIRKVSVQDALSSAIFGASLEDTHFALRFKGKLVGQSITHVFADFPYEFGELSGDIRTKGDWTSPGRGTVEGVLQGETIGIPPVLLPDSPMPVTLEKFSLSGSDQKMLIETATITAGDGRLDVTGSIDGSSKLYQLDLDVRGDKFLIPLPERPPPAPETTPQTAADEGGSKIDKVTASSEQRLTKVENTLEQIPATGQIRVNIGELHIGAIEMAPFIANASMGNSMLDLKLQEVRLCNILLTGGMSAQMNGRAQSNIKARAQDIPIEQSIPCLTNQRIQIVGLMNVDAEFDAAGTGDDFLKSARATFALSARDGKIEKFDSLGKVFNTVNSTRAEGKKLPELRKNDLPFKLMSAKGKIDLHAVQFDEIVLDIKAAKVVANGKLEFRTQKVNGTVLVAPLKTIDKIIGWMPILGRIFGGTALAIPVGISGTLSSPTVRPLSPTAVTDRVLKIFTNTLKLPVDLVQTAPQNDSEAGEGSDETNSSQ